MDKQFGNCEYIYGVNYDDTECIIIETLAEERVPEFEAEGLDDTGNVVAVVRGEEKVSFTINGFMKAACDLSKYTGGECKITLVDTAGINYECIVEKWSVNESNRDFKKVELVAVHHPNATRCCVVVN